MLGLRIECVSVKMIGLRIECASRFQVLCDLGIEESLEGRVKLVKSWSLDLACKGFKT